MLEDEGANYVVELAICKASQVIIVSTEQIERRLCLGRKFPEMLYHLWACRNESRPSLLSATR